MSRPLMGCDSLRQAADHIWETCFSCRQPGDGAHGPPWAAGTAPAPACSSWGHGLRTCFSLLRPFLT